MHLFQEEESIMATSTVPRSLGEFDLCIDLLSELRVKCARGLPEALQVWAHMGERLMA